MQIKHLDRVKFRHLIDLNISNGFFLLLSVNIDSAIILPSLFLVESSVILLVQLSVGYVCFCVTLPLNQVKEPWFTAILAHMLGIC